MPRQNYFCLDSG